MIKKLFVTIITILVLCCCKDNVSAQSTYSTYSTNQSYYNNNAHAHSFKNEQLNFIRVRRAQDENDYRLRREFESVGLIYPPTEIYMRAFKHEGILELWAKDNFNNFAKFKEYTICASTGVLGPKRREGDEQAPEGFYRINEFNPTSQYHLSLGINYPNRADRMVGVKGKLGGDIFVHGACLTVGCLPLTNKKMAEVYWLSVLARSNGQQNIPLHIFPYKFSDYDLDHFMRQKFVYMSHVLHFWENLKIGYNYFESTKTIPRIDYNYDGTYTFF